MTSELQATRRQDFLKISHIAIAISEIEIELIRKDGSTFHALLRIAAVRGNDGAYALPCDRDRHHRA